MFLCFEMWNVFIGIDDLGMVVDLYVVCVVFFFIDDFFVFRIFVFFFNYE